LAATLRFKGQRKIEIERERSKGEKPQAKRLKRRRLRRHGVRLGLIFFCQPPNRQGETEQFPVLRSPADAE
jgi:hypothetical protein